VVAHLVRDWRRYVSEQFKRQRFLHVGRERHELFHSFHTGYTSDAPLSATMTFNSATLASLGITQGSYVYDLTFSGGSAQNITLNAVPEPSTVGLLAMAAATCGGGLVRRLRRRRMLSAG